MHLNHLPVRRLAWPALATLVTLSLAACGSAEDAGAQVASLDTAADDDAAAAAAPATTIEPKDVEEVMLEYTQCMREHGVDLPDPQDTGDGGAVMELPAAIDDDAFEEAQTACQSIMEGALPEMDVDPEQQKEIEEQLLAYAECMREHGIDMPDPEFGGDGGVIVAIDAAGPPDDGDDPGPARRNPFDDPQFEAADAECSSLMPEVPGRRTSVGGDGTDSGPGVVVGAATDAADGGE